MNFIKILADRIYIFRDQKNLAKSYAQPVIEGYGRDALKYYFGGHSVVVPATLMAGCDVDRILVANYKYKWNNGTELTKQEEEQMLMHLRNFFAKKGVTYQIVED